MHHIITYWMARAIAQARHPKDSLPLTYINPPAGAIPISMEIAEQLGIVEDDRHFDIKTFGPWQIPLSVRGIRMSTRFDRTRGYTVTLSTTVWGEGTLSHPKQDGYQLEGTASLPLVGNVRAFTSAQMFELPGRKLRNCCEIFCCTGKDKE